MGRMVDVTFTTQRVFHDGMNMVVKKAGETATVSAAQARTFLTENAIEHIDDLDPKQREHLRSPYQIQPEPGGEEVASKPLEGEGSGIAPDGAPTFAPMVANGETTSAEDAPAGASESLTGMSKAELLNQARDEGVDVDAGMTKAEIIAAIGDARAAGDEAPAA